MAVTKKRQENFMCFDPWIKHSHIIAKIIELCFLIWYKNFGFFFVFKITDFKVAVKIMSILVYSWLQFLYLSVVKQNVDVFSHLS